jgi:hypothetical protein
MREIRLSGSMRGMWKRRRKVSGLGSPSELSDSKEPDGTTIAPHLYSTGWLLKAEYWCMRYEYYKPCTSKKTRLADILVTYRFTTDLAQRRRDAGMDEKVFLCASARKKSITKQEVTIVSAGWLRFFARK